MRKTLGYHLVKTGYGLWLPGDERGSWSSAWDAQIGYYEPHMLHPGDPVRKRMAAERMKAAPVRFSETMMRVILEAIDRCAANSRWRVGACSLEPTHLHLQVTYFDGDIHRMAKWLSAEMTKAVHHRTNHQGPVWTKGKWCSYIFNERTWHGVRRYIEQHNERRGLPPRPYSFIESPEVLR
jgi:REP element-mobilizing transposase RayT